MDNDQFSNWYSHHRSLYASLPSWLSKNGNIKETLKAWASQLSSVRFDDAIRASDELYDATNQPRSYDRHPAEIKKLCRRYVTEREGRKTFAKFTVPTVGCKDCNDLGLATIIVHRTEGVTITTAYDVMNAALDDLKEGRRVAAFHCAVRCDCREQNGNNFTARLQRGVMLLWDRSMVGKSMQEQRFWDSLSLPPVIGGWDGGSF